MNVGTGTKVTTPVFGSIVYVPSFAIVTLVVGCIVDGSIN